MEKKIIRDVNFIYIMKVERVDVVQREERRAADVDRPTAADPQLRRVVT